MKMKFTFLMIVLALSSVAGASPTGPFGLKAGLYLGKGNVHSRPFFIPKAKLTSYREFRGEGFKLFTIVKVGPFKVGEGRANLRISPTQDGQFLILDEDRDLLPVGKGECHVSICQLEARILNGTLYLNETWQIREDGFEIVQAYQIFKKIISDYSGNFNLTEE